MVGGRERLLVERLDSFLSRTVSSSRPKRRAVEGQYRMVRPPRTSGTIRMIGTTKNRDQHNVLKVSDQ